MKRLNKTLWSFGLLLLLAACGSVPPAPTDRFYRLQPAHVAPAATSLPGAVAVNAFRADSLYAERPIVYSDEASLRQLRQYHYHLWLYPPAPPRWRPRHSPSDQSPCPACHPYSAERCGCGWWHSPRHSAVAW